MARFTPYSQNPNDVNQAHNTLVEQLNKAWTIIDAETLDALHSTDFMRSTGGQIYKSVSFGDSTSYTNFSSNGTLTLKGDATVYDDRDYPMGGQRISAPGAKVDASTSNTVDFSNGCPLTDYVEMNIQMSHSKKLYSPIMPHLHWVQASTKMPNWLLEYRWQTNGLATTIAWTRSTVITNKAAWTTGILNQISDFTAITPSTVEQLSDILQVKLKRDSANTSSKFASTDPYGATVATFSFDIHYEKDSLGSAQEYVK